ncbi:MAG: fibronectin type III domain-containing protein [Parabacteroides gordonii]|uniref:fibronectin type III domain-containing protein n=1 Tax=Parabacteroides gordonii TaxID=574930 RepID=UPI003A878128
MRKSYLLSIFWAFSIVFAWGQNENWIDKADISWYTGHEDDKTYKISTAAQLAGLAKLVNEGTGNGNPIGFSGKTIQLTTDISLNEGKNVLDEDGELINDGDGLMEWTPIGVSLSFQGIFDGNGHVVKGIYIKTDNHFTGLFGRITENSEIKNIGVVDSYIEGSYFVGGICGYASESTIYNCYNTTNVTGNITDASIGGICGNISESTIYNCYNTGYVTGKKIYSLAGGICGNPYDSYISNCYNAGMIQITESYYAGGICGQGKVTIVNCYNIGSITGGTDNRYIGGICGSAMVGTSISNSTYLIGSAEKGIGGYINEDAIIPLTAPDLVIVINKAFKEAGWQGEASYKNGILTLPSVGNETVPAAKLSTLTENDAIEIDYAAETITVKGNSKFDVSYAIDFNSLISTGNAIHPEEIIYARYAGGSKDGLISDILKITLPARPATPKAPTTTSITTDAITLATAGSNAQYSRTDGRTWQTSPTFSNLMPETSYTFLARIQATSTCFASNTSEPATFRTAAIEPISYSYTIPNAIGAIIEGAGSNTAREGSRITFRIRLDPNGNGVYPTARINNQTDVRHEGNGFYSFYISTDSEVSIDEVDYTFYNVTCPTDTVFDSITDTYSTGAGIRVTDARGHQANAFPYGSTIRLNAPDNTFRRFRHWWDLSRNRPYEIVLTDHLEATATFEALHPVANETINTPGLRITSGHGYVEVETPQRLPIRLYHISGRLLHQADHTGTIRFGNLTTGTYLLTAGTERQLILVR